MRDLDGVRLKLDGIRGAARAIDAVFVDTPALTCAPLGAALGCSVTLKVESRAAARSRRVTTILCGSNVAPGDFARWVLEPAAH